MPHAFPEAADTAPLTPRHPLDGFFHPRQIAVIGASETPGSVGRAVLRNLVSTPFGGTVYPVNPKRNSVLGIRACPSIADVPERVDLAIIVTPAATVPDIIGQCADAQVRNAIIISAGFKEIGDEGAELEWQVLNHARRGRMRIIGPNCLGVMRPTTGLNATFAAAPAKPGNVAFISQSGALCTAILDRSLQEDFGFSAFISIGSMLDVGWGDLIDYLGDDPHTKAIVIYMESIGDAGGFLSAAREVALTKPIILIKAGRTSAAAKAAASHTGALAGSNAVLEAACRRTGVLRVDDIQSLFLMTEVLAKQPRPRGNRLSIITNAGGPGVLATDALIESGGQLAELSDETRSKLHALLPPHWSRGNPIDILGDADAQRYLKTLQVAAEDPNADGLLVILTPQAMTDPTKTAEALQTCARRYGKPVLASWMGEAAVERGRQMLNQAGIPTLSYPDTACRLFTYMWRYSYNLQGLYETPVLPADADDPPDRAAVHRLFHEARDDERTLLTEIESKQLLAAYGLPTTPMQVAANVDEAVATAEAMDYPVVLKLHSHTITHKTDVAGVQLNLVSADAVRDAFERIRAGVTKARGAEHFQGVTVQPMERLDGYELIIGCSLDPQFGPVLLFGAGGQLVEVFQDSALALPPLNTTLARRMMEQTRIYKALQGVRGRAAVDLRALEAMLARFSQLIVEQPRIKEIDINPLLASPDRLLALDARIVLHDWSVADDDLPRSAIRPYPTQYIAPFTLKNGQQTLIRPIRPEDEPQLVRFHEGLSERTVYLRFFQAMKLSTRIAHDRLRRRCFIDYNREMALVVEHRDEAGQRVILGIGRLSKVPGTADAEFAIVVADTHQHQGMGTELLRRLIDIARFEQVHRIYADILPDNTSMQRAAERLGFTITHTRDEETLRASLDL